MDGLLNLLDQWETFKKLRHTGGDVELWPASVARVDLCLESRIREKIRDDRTRAEARDYEIGNAGFTPR